MKALQKTDLFKKLDAKTKVPTPQTPYPKGFRVQASTLNPKR
jgi:hypothetical protein